MSMNSQIFTLLMFKFYKAFAGNVGRWVWAAAA
jgi:hypothetical protein